MLDMFFMPNVVTSGDYLGCLVEVHLSWSRNTLSSKEKEKGEEKVKYTI